MLNPIIPARQWTSYSCGAAVLQIGVRYFTGRHLSHIRAIHLTGCRPDGVSMTRLKTVFRGCGLSVGRLGLKARFITAALDAGKLVVIDDNRTYTDSHVMIVAGYTRTRFWVVDPVVGLPTLRLQSRVLRSAEAAFTIYKRNPARTARRSR